MSLIVCIAIKEESLIKQEEEKVENHNDEIIEIFKFNEEDDEKESSNLQDVFSNTSEILYLYWSDESKNWFYDEDISQCINSVDLNKALELKGKINLICLSLI